MPRKTINPVGSFILTEFVRGILESTNSYRATIIGEGVREILSYHNQLENIERKEKLLQSREVKKIVREKIREDSEIVSNLEGSFNSSSRKLFAEDRSEQRGYLSSFRIPDSVLPETVRHIKPVPRPERINLGRLNKLLNDPFVKTIECNGPDEKIVVIGVMGRKITLISLSKEEVDDVLLVFSELGKIPLKPGLFKVVFGNLMLSAIVSEIAGSRFSIQKMPLGM
ncbi:MAG: hypothetical protein Q8P81_00705 [Nanoarchaeota archaeon]|nr:hypothetical protein [Nanoarchaeota archaeon]